MAPEDLSDLVAQAGLVDLNELEGQVGLVGLSDLEVQNYPEDQVALEVPLAHEGQDVSAFLDVHECLEVLAILEEALVVQQTPVGHHLLGADVDLVAPFVLEVLEV